MTAPVRLRGEVGERPSPVGWNRRVAVTPRAAELAAEIERLRGFIAALEHHADVAKLAAGAGAGEVADA